MKATIRPNNPQIRPFKKFLPESVAMKVMPNSASRKNSAGLNARIMGSRMESESPRNTAPIRPPTVDAPKLAPRALPAKPLRVIA